MSLWTPFPRAFQPKSAQATNTLPHQAPAGSGSWTACILAVIASACLIFSAGAQNVSYGWQLGAVHSEFRAVVLALASAGATLLAPVCFAAVVVCWRRRSFGVGLVALTLGVLALGYASTCSLGTVAGSREIAVSEHLRGSESAADKRALVKAARDELTKLKGQRPDVVERRAELTAILVDLSKEPKAREHKADAARPDSQAAGVAFVLKAFGWHVTTADVGQWLNILTVGFLELAASLSLMVATSLRPQKPVGASPAATLPALVPDAPKPLDAPVRPSKRPVAPSRKEDDRDDPPKPPRNRGGRPATVIPREALDRLRKAGGKANGSIRGVGKLIGAKSKTTAWRVLHRLAASGSIRLQVGPHGCAVAVA